MASRVVEVLYKLKDLFTPNAKKIEKGYEGIAAESTKTTKTVERNSKVQNKSFTRAIASIGKLKAAFVALRGVHVVN